MRMRLLLAGLCLTLAAPPVARAQNSPIVDLLLRARMALNDLRFAQSDSLTRMVLTTFGSRLTRAQRLEVLTIAAATQYPEPASGGRQRPDSALAFLRALVRLDPAASPLADMSWSGLDSLFQVARRTTFALGATPRADYVLVGPTGEMAIEAFTTRPARFTLTAMPVAGGSPVITDSAGPADRAALRVRAFAGDRPALVSGAYAIEISATDTATGERLVQRYTATATVPPLELADVPRALDSAQLRPEIAPPARRRAILAGVLLGGGAAAAATMRGPAPLTSAGADTRGYAVGAALAVGAIIGGLLDRGRTLPLNVAANQSVRAAFDASVRTAQADNRARIAAFRLTITIQEAR